LEPNANDANPKGTQRAAAGVRTFALASLAGSLSLLIGGPILLTL